MLLRFRAYLEVLSELSTSTARNVLFADMRDTLFQGDPFDPAVLPPARQSAMTPGGELPYVLFSEEGDLEHNATFREDQLDQMWARPITSTSFLLQRSGGLCQAVLQRCTAVQYILALPESTLVAKHCRASLYSTAYVSANSSDYNGNRLLRCSQYAPRMQAFCVCLERCRHSRHNQTQFQEADQCEPQIRDCFNESVVDAMIDQTVVCAGTIIGGRTALMSYLQLMSDVAHFVTKESCMEYGVDQVITCALISCEDSVHATHVMRLRVQLFLVALCLMGQHAWCSSARCAWHSAIWASLLHAQGVSSRLVA